MNKTGPFTLEIEDLTRLGGPMGSENTTSQYKHFSTIEKAKDAAEKLYNGSRGPIKWRGNKSRITSGDLGYVMYSIRPLKIDRG